MHKPARFSLDGNVVVPAAGDVGVLVEAQDARGEGIAVMVVVKQPAVEAGLAESGLHSVEFHREMITAGGSGTM